MKNPNLSSTELSVAILVANGDTLKQIASRLGISKKTVEKHISNVHKKTGTHCAIEVAKWLMRNGYLTLYEWLDMEPPEIGKDTFCVDGRYVVYGNKPKCNTES